MISYLLSRKDRPGDGHKEVEILHLHTHNSLIDDEDGMFLMLKYTEGKTDFNTGNYKEYLYKEQFCITK